MRQQWATCMYSIMRHEVINLSAAASPSRQTFSRDVSSCCSISHKQLHSQVQAARRWACSLMKIMYSSVLLGFPCNSHWSDLLHRFHASYQMQDMISSSHASSLPRL